MTEITYLDRTTGNNLCIHGIHAWSEWFTVRRSYAEGYTSDFYILKQRTCNKCNATEEMETFK